MPGRQQGSHDVVTIRAGTGAQQQFRSLGRDDAHDLAVDLLAAYEGSALLANTLRDPGILTGAADRISRWIDAILSGADSVT